MNQIYCTSRCNKPSVNSAVLQRDRQCRMYAQVSSETKYFFVDLISLEGL
jgi:hypothetical protein